MSSDKVIFSHIPIYVDDNPFLGSTVLTYATVAALYDKEKGTFAYAVAFCSPSDRFCRKTGRLEATRLLFENGKRTRILKNVSFGNVSYYQMCLQAFKLELMSKQVPKWYKQKHCSV